MVNVRTTRTTTTRIIRWRLAIVGAVLAAAVSAGGGCADPRIEEAHARRLASIEQVLATAEARESVSDERLADTFQVIDSESARHDRKLAETVDFVQESLRREVEQWPARREESEAEIRKQLAGDPNNIGETVLKMFY